MTASMSWEFHACTHACANCRASVSESIRCPFYIQLYLRRVSKTHQLMHRTPMALCGLRFADQQAADFPDHIKFGAIPSVRSSSMSRVGGPGRLDHGVKQNRHRNAAEVRKTVVGHSKPATA